MIKFTFLEKVYKVIPRRPYFADAALKILLKGVVVLHVKVATELASLLLDDVYRNLQLSFGLRRNQIHATLDLSPLEYLKIQVRHSKLKFNT